VKGIVKTSLDVGFAGGFLPERYAGLRGRAYRSIGLMPEFPFEDAQFEVVILESSIVGRSIVKEAHRVLKPGGRLFFTVNEKTSKQEGFTLPDIYAIVREGFNIIGVERPAWWKFGRGGRTISICAQKKTWKEYKGFGRNATLAVSPFRSHT
jgi:SAM-dependent methyltransferase